MVTANIEVGEFDTLTLDPGVTLLFNKDFGINVLGIYPTSLCYLHVNGTLEGIVLKRNYAEMKNISSTFSKGHGFTINLQQTSGNVSWSILEELTAANNKKNGLQINSADKTVTKILISKCNVYQNDESGFSVYANIQTVIEDCLIKENKQRGVYVEQSKGGDIFIKSSTLHRNALYALEVLATNKIVLESCFVTENSHTNNYYSYGAYSCLNLKSYHVVSVKRNTFMNRQTTGMCELQAPVFDEAYSINATHNYWGSSSLVDVLEVVCGFDRSMEKSYVHYMPFSTSEENNDFIAYAQDDFDVQNVLGGEITGTFTIEYKEEAKKISRSIFVRTNALLNIANGIKMQFDEKRGIYVQGNVTLHDAYISNTEIGIQSKDKFLDLKNITINNSHGACLSMLSGAEGKFDFDGSLFHNCVNHGIFLSKYINASFTGLDISSSYEGIQLITDQTGHLILHNIGIKNSSLFAVHVEFNHNSYAGNITIHDIKVTDSQTDGFRDILYHVFDIFTNKFMGIDGYCVIELKSHSHFVNPKGTVQFNNLILNKVSRGVVVLDTSYFNISQNIFDNHGSTFDFYTTGSGRLNCVNLRARRPVKRPLLTRRHRQARHQWSLGHRNRTLRQWRYVHWSDERRFLQHHIDERMRVWRPRNTAYRKQYILGTTAFGGDAKINATKNWFVNMTLSLVRDRIYDERQDPSLMSVTVAPLLIEWKLDCSLVNNCKQLKKREKGYTPIYLDETWVDTNHTTSHQWTSPDESQNRKIPLGKGQRFVVLHAGCETGFLKGCDLVFKGMSTDGRDYHTEMNGKVFEQWVEKQLVPALPPKSLIVMDNASYHSVRVDGTKAPTSNSRKGDMKDFLNKHGLKFDSKFTKPKLYEIIKSKKIAPTPPYHCDLNPIELIWGDLKGFIGKENSTFKLNDVKSLIQRGFEQIDSTKWLKSCDHVKNIIEPSYWKNDAIQEEIQKIVIHIQSDSESESEMDDSSDGDETEDYEWP
ncbi:unnamed protein product [Mytilus edulis]|uniref:Tc1-like transposase DDE domain-containing protein n=1 Tax=Mytilus edulis TaxID=6550 RepID=A0A8S3UUH8_MYTED|nr:unnamed protein product [Mytilus edulis]